MGRRQVFPKTMMRLALIAMVTLITVASAGAQTERVLHNFGGNTKDGVGPGSSLVADSSGNFYGTTTDGGTDKVGTVFKLAPKTGGGWTESVLYSFIKNNVDGQGPQGGVTFDSSGNLYGTTGAGGANGVGTVFELTPPVSPATRWTEKVLYSFLDNNVDGQNPLGNLAFDSSGNLYGVTEEGGTYAVGTVFELSPTAGGGWTESVLHSFHESISMADGADPRAGVTLDSAGNLYGTTLFGGSLGGGTVYELSKSSAATWTEEILYNFANDSVDGGLPAGGLTFDASGNLYGTTTQGGPKSGGTVFKLTHSSGGSWTEKVLYYFLNGNSSDGYNPICNLIFDAAGDIYGTTLIGGTGTCTKTGGCGIVFELKPASGLWSEKVLHDFNDNGSDGYYPEAGVIGGAGGNLYGSTFYGGSFDSGTVYTVKP